MPLITTLKEPAMADESAYEPLPPRTQEEIDALVAFIQDRVKPLRDRGRSDAEECKAFQALLDLAFYAKGVARMVIERGDDPSLQFYHLAAAARNWDDHPDFQSDWSG